MRAGKNIGLDFRIVCDRAQEYQGGYGGDSFCNPIHMWPQYPNSTSAPHPRSTRIVLRCPAESEANREIGVPGELRGHRDWRLTLKTTAYF